MSQVMRRCGQLMGMGFGFYLLTRGIQNAIDKNPQIATILRQALDRIDQDYPRTAQFIKVTWYHKKPLAGLIIGCVIFYRFDKFSLGERNSSSFSALNKRGVFYWVELLIAVSYFREPTCFILRMMRIIFHDYGPIISSIFPSPLDRRVSALFFYLTRPSIDITHFPPLDMINLDYPDLANEEGRFHPDEHPICPITKKFIRYPVVAFSADGNTLFIFERKAILAWLFRRATNPVTGGPMYLADLREHISLRRKIEQSL